MRTISYSALVAAGLIAAIAASAIAAAEPDSKVARAQHVVERHLSQLKAPSATITYIADKCVRELFPDDLLFGVRFRLYPVAIAPPHPLKSQNLIDVRAATAAEITSIDDLKAWFRRRLDHQKPRGSQKQAVRAWLALAEELIQDGFYTFEIREDSFHSSPAGTDMEVSGTFIVRSGGKGEFRVTLGFYYTGELLYEYWSNTVKPGPRPICQATKLLDRDPIMRRMAEQDILVMGRASKPYLDEQRAKAAPALRRAIDRVWRRILQEGW